MRISVITVTWNSGTTLEDTMRSVLVQSYPDIEHIIVDGASTDGTMDIVRGLAPEYNGRLHYISEKDNGLYDAINKGIAMASGDIVGILNSDDFFTANDVLAKVAETFGKEKELDAVYGDIHFVRNDDLHKCVRYYSSKRFQRKFMRMGFMPAHPSFYCKKIVYERYGNYKLTYKIAADFECLLRLIFINRIQTKYLPVDFVTMRTGGVSTSGWKSHKRIMEEHQRAFKENGVYSCIPLQLLRYVYKLVQIAKTRLGKPVPAFS